MPAAARLFRPHSPTEDFIERGYHRFDAPVDPAAAGRLLAKIRATRAFDGRLFLSEPAFDADPQHTGVNPHPGRNLLEAFDGDLAFVERDPMIVAGLAELLGDDLRDAEQEGGLRRAGQRRAGLAEGADHRQSGQ
ncbi:MAG: hypothetical protein WDM85_09170 [Caulobacteraceae bacterium]